MDNVKHYQEIVRRLIEQYADKPSHGEIDSEIIIDQEGKHYELMHIGWDGARRVHGSVLHIDLIDGKIWIQHDGTAPGVALDLVEAGVPRQDIVLAFRPPDVRVHTGYAVG